MASFVRSGDAQIAYRVDGEGPLAILFYSGFLVTIDMYDEEPHLARFCRRLSSMGRLVRFDARGVGLSDAGDGELTIDQAVADVLAVMDAAGVDQAVVVGCTAGGGPMSIQLAATAPERVRALVLIDASARSIVDDDYPIGAPEELARDFIERAFDPNDAWSFLGADALRLAAPSLADDVRFREWNDRAVRMGASPSAVRRFFGLGTFADVRRHLGAVRAPTLVLARRDSLLVPVTHSRYIAERIAGAKLVELPGADSMPFSGDADALLDEIEEFVTGRRSGSADRALATLVFSDIVGSTKRASEIGDAAWRAELDAHDVAVRREVARFGGREVNTTGDGFVVLFESPTSAVECARSIARNTGLPVRVGVHTGECERRGDDVAGVAVHIAARVADFGGAGDVVVSRTVADLVEGSGLRFRSLGEHALKGVARPWELFALEP